MKQKTKDTNSDKSTVKTPVLVMGLHFILFFLKMSKLIFIG